MDEQKESVGSPSRAHPSTEAPMLREDVVRELLARLERGEGIKPIARALGVDRKTVKRWRQVGQWRRQVRRRARQIDPFLPFLEQRGPEVGWNCAVLHRELRALGYQAGVLQVQRYVQPRRAARRWAAVATVRFETAPGQQGQVPTAAVDRRAARDRASLCLHPRLLAPALGAGLSPRAAGRRPRRP